MQGNALHLNHSNHLYKTLKKYPKLTTIGAWRQRDVKTDGPGAPRYGGFYTQAEIREVVAYAAARHITIVPEVDFPGHSTAAMVAYPELAPDNGWKPQFPVINAHANKGAIKGPHALCVAKPQTVQFCWTNSARCFHRRIFTSAATKPIASNGRIARSRKRR